MASKYAKRHYEDLADMIGTSADLDSFRNKLEDRFAEDNPRFDRSRFRKAAGY